MWIASLISSSLSSLPAAGSIGTRTNVLSHLRDDGLVNEVPIGL